MSPLTAWRLQAGRHLSSSIKAPPPIKLIYFNLRGRLESVKMMLSAASVPYTEEVMARGDSWVKMRTSGAFPFDQLPVVQFGNQQLAQSGAITRHVAHLTGFLPGEPWDAALANQLFDATQELEGAMPLVNLLSGERHAEFKHKFMKRLPRRLDNLSKAIGGENFLLAPRGGGICYADFALHFVCDLCLLVEPTALDKNADLRKHMGLVEASSQGVADYIKTRPKPVGIGTDPRMEQVQ